MVSAGAGWPGWQDAQENAQEICLLGTAAKCGKAAEITRFKGLGEINASEFKQFIGPDMRLDPVGVDHQHALKDLLSFYMGKNTPERQEFIIRNLRVEQDIIESDEPAPLDEAA